MQYIWNIELNCFLVAERNLSSKVCKLAPFEMLITLLTVYYGMINIILLTDISHHKHNSKSTDYSESHISIFYILENVTMEIILWNWMEIRNLFQKWDSYTAIFYQNRIFSQLSEELKFNVFTNLKCLQNCEKKLRKTWIWRFNVIFAREKYFQRKCNDIGGHSVNFSHGIIKSHVYIMKPFVYNCQLNYCAQKNTSSKIYVINNAIMQ